VTARNAARRAATIEMATASLIFAALGDRMRLGLLARLCDDGPQSVVELARGLSITRQGVSKHLRVMERAGLVRAAWHGRERVWRLDTPRLAAARRHIDRLSLGWDTALSRRDAQEP
jgi:DNA-binding transcriptional ArsR family regulator